MLIFARLPNKTHELGRRIHKSIVHYREILLVNGSLHTFVVVIVGYKEANTTRSVYQPTQCTVVKLPRNKWVLFVPNC